MKWVIIIIIAITSLIVVREHAIKSCIDREYIKCCETQQLHCEYVKIECKEKASLICRNGLDK